MKGVPIVISARSVREKLPKADTDVLIWNSSNSCGQLGAYVAEEDGQPVWVDAQGARVPNVTHWAHLPLLVTPGRTAAACTGSQTQQNS